MKGLNEVERRVYSRSGPRAEGTGCYVLRETGILIKDFQDCSRLYCQNVFHFCPPGPGEDCTACPSGIKFAKEM